jgi:hypothetical protein
VTVDSTKRLLSHSGDPDPASLTDSELLYELAAALRIYAHDAHPRIPALIDVARDRAAMFFRLTEAICRCTAIIRDDDGRLLCLEHGDVSDRRGEIDTSRHPSWWNKG